MVTRNRQHLGERHREKGLHADSGQRAERGSREAENGRLKKVGGEDAPLMHADTAEDGYGRPALAREDVYRAPHADAAQEERGETDQPEVATEVVEPSG